MTPVIVDNIDACIFLGDCIFISTIGEGNFILWAELAALYRGEMPLDRAFWEFAIAYGTTANIVATIASR